MRSIALFLLLDATALTARPPLAYVFCTELIYRRDHGLVLEQDDTAWADFTGRLESGATRADPLAKIDSDRLQRCISEHRDEMDEGEFLLGGKRLLASLASEARGAKGEHSLEPLLGSVNLPGFGDFPLNALTRRSENSSLERMTQRSSRYESLWESFLGRLRKTMSIHPLKMKTAPSN